MSLRFSLRLRSSNELKSSITTAANRPSTVSLPSYRAPFIGSPRGHHVKNVIARGRVEAEIARGDAKMFWVVEQPVRLSVAANDRRADSFHCRTGMGEVVKPHHHGIFIE